MDRDYLLRRVCAERRLARRAASPAAADAHHQMAEHYAARLAALGDGEPDRPWFAWRWPGTTRSGIG